MCEYDVLWSGINDTRKAESEADPQAAESHFCDGITGSGIDAAHVKISNQGAEQKQERGDRHSCFGTLD